MVLYVFYAFLVLPFLIWIGAGFVGRIRQHRRFRSCVDPKVVQYVIDHGDAPPAPGTLQDVSVLFTNITDSVAMFERLGDVAAVEVINQYYSAITPAIRRHDGYIAKFFGDGVMAFFGAPISPDTEHAAHAVAAVLAIEVAIDELNGRLAAAGKPVLIVRVGLASGLGIVGDAGPASASDYTVIGDVVNAASVLEKLCKKTATRNLIADVTVARLNGLFTFRPIDSAAAPLPPQLGVSRVFEVVSSPIPVVAPAR